MTTLVNRLTIDPGGAERHDKHHLTRRLPQPGDPCSQQQTTNLAPENKTTEFGTWTVDKSIPDSAGSQADSLPVVQNRLVCVCVCVCVYLFQNDFRNAFLKSSI